jgi:hypothetical protein
MIQFEIDHAEDMLRWAKQEAEEGLNRIASASEKLSGIDRADYVKINEFGREVEAAYNRFILASRNLEKIYK